MWLFCELGFFSAVEHGDHPDAVVVRARVRRDLEALRDRLLPDLDIEDTPERDYAHRAVVGRDEWSFAVCRIAEELDYRNFKAAVAERQGAERAARYAEVWRVMLRVQRDERQEPDALPD